jgi:hypothetical protein
VSCVADWQNFRRDTLPSTREEGTPGLGLVAGRVAGTRLFLSESASSSLSSPNTAQSDSIDSCLPFSEVRKARGRAGGTLSISGAPPRASKAPIRRTQTLKTLAYPLARSGRPGPGGALLRLGGVDSGFRPDPTAPSLVLQILFPDRVTREPLCRPLLLQHKAGLHEVAISVERRRRRAGARRPASPAKEMRRKCRGGRGWLSTGRAKEESDKLPQKLLQELQGRSKHRCLFQGCTNRGR